MLHKKISLFAFLVVGTLLISPTSMATQAKSKNEATAPVADEAEARAIAEDKYEAEKARLEAEEAKAEAAEAAKKAEIEALSKEIDGPESLFGNPKFITNPEYGGCSTPKQRECAEKKIIEDSNYGLDCLNRCANKRIAIPLKSDAAAYCRKWCELKGGTQDCQNECEQKVELVSKTDLWADQKMTSLGKTPCTNFCSMKIMGCKDESDKYYKEHPEELEKLDPCMKPKLKTRLMTGDECRAEMSQARECGDVVIPVN